MFRGLVCKAVVKITSTARNEERYIYDLDLVLRDDVGDVQALVETFILEFEPIATIHCSIEIPVT